VADRAGADAPAVTYMIDGVQYISIAAGGVTGNGIGSQRGDMLWTFALNGPSKLQPMPNPTVLPIIVTGFTGAIVQGTTLTPPNNVSVADFATRRIASRSSRRQDHVRQQGTHGAHRDIYGRHRLDTGTLGTGDSAAFTFDQPGTYYYTCTPHPFMVGQILVADADGKVPDVPSRRARTRTP